MHTLAPTYHTPLHRTPAHCTVALFSLVLLAWLSTAHTLYVLVCREWNEIVVTDENINCVSTDEYKVIGMYSKTITVDSDDVWTFCDSNARMERANLIY
jgi:hypothetical protein